MAVLTPDQVTTCWEQGTCEKFGLYAVKLVNTGDTYDLSPNFRLVTQSTWMGATVSGTVTGAQSGTVVTAPSGLTSAGAFLLVSGIAR
jgi:hypothetical protein